MITFKEMSTKNERSLMIVDSLNLGFRWMHSGAKDFAQEYVDTVNSLASSYKCSKVIIAGDMGSSKYRKTIYPAYKQNRKDKYENQTPEEAKKFEDFFAEMQRILTGFETSGMYPVLRFPGVEADDIAAYVCSKPVRRKYNIEKIWNISSDKDWNLLIDKDVSQFSTVTRKEFTLENWSQNNECTIEEYISIKCLMGDSGDNVLGVKGIGPKKALQLVKEYGSTYDIIASLPIQSKYKHIQALNDFGSENLLLNYKLMDLVTYCEEAIGEENCNKINQTLQDYLL